MKKIELYISSKYEYMETEEQAIKRAKILLALGFDVSIKIKEIVEKTK